MTSRKPLRYAPYYPSHRRHPRTTPTSLSPSPFTPCGDIEAAIASDLSQADMQMLLARLSLSNDVGEMLTFNIVTKDWEPWY
jgi:hypothetical protein